MKSREYGIELIEVLEQVTESIAKKKSVKKSIRKAKEAVLKSVNECAIIDIIYISTCINSCWAKFRKYYSLMD